MPEWHAAGPSGSVVLLAGVLAGRLLWRTRSGAGAGGVGAGTGGSSTLIFWIPSSRMRLAFLNLLRSICSSYADLLLAWLRACSSRWLYSWRSSPHPVKFLAGSQVRLPHAHTTKYLIAPLIPLCASISVTTSSLALPLLRLLALPLLLLPSLLGTEQLQHRQVARFGCGLVGGCRAWDERRL